LPGSRRRPEMSGHPIKTARFKTITHGELHGLCSHYGNLAAFCAEITSGIRSLKGPPPRRPPLSRRFYGHSMDNSECWRPGRGGGAKGRQELPYPNGLGGRGAAGGLGGGERGPWPRRVRSKGRGQGRRVRGPAGPPVSVEHLGGRFPDLVSLPNAAIIT
jgi:hypothetical protein